MKMETRRIILSDGQRIDIPAPDWPWITEYTWSYDAMKAQLYRIENGRTILLFNELLKHAREDKDLLIMSDTAVDALFQGTPPYIKLLDILPRYIEAGKEQGIVLPNPYEIIANSVAKVIQVYYSWLLSGHKYVLSRDGDERADASMLRVHREEIYPYQAADQYPTIRDWMYGEWTGDFDLETAARNPVSYSDKVYDTIWEVLKWMFQQVNIIFDFEEIQTFFAKQGLSLDDIAATVQLLVETYPTPAR